MNAYRQVRNRAISMNSRLRKFYFTNRRNLCEGDPKQSWSTINKRSKSTQIPSLNVNCAIIKDSKCIANSMNDYFCYVGDLNKEIPDIENCFLKGAYDINPTTAAAKVSALNKFRTSHGSGLDGISRVYPISGYTIISCSLTVGRYLGLHEFLKLVQRMKAAIIGRYRFYR